MYLCRMQAYDQSLNDARAQDQIDDLRLYRDRFFVPKGPDGQEAVYLCGNSLGLQPLDARVYIEEVLEQWATRGVEGHVEGPHPWMPYHTFLTEKMAGVVGAQPSEVVVMNSLTVNLHLLMVSFYRPRPDRRKILIEFSPFPSDRYAVCSQIAFHGGDPASDLLELKPRPGGDQVYYEDLEALMAREGEQIALILLGGVNYYTGQAYDIRRVTELGHRYGCMVGFDLAHAAGNLDLHLHEAGPDFAAWCSYKYLNGGPGALSGIFVHERHAEARGLPRFTGWWGHDKDSRFQMPDAFQPMPGAEGWQLSNPPILSMAGMMASLDLFHEVGMQRLVAKSRRLTGYMEALLQDLGEERISVITPSDPDQRGCQLSLRVRGADKSLFDRISAQGVIADWRAPDVIRVAPVPFYNSYEDVYRFVAIIRNAL
jgi:kynureninase